MVFNAPCLTDKKELIYHEVEMVINSPWIMPLLGTKRLASPEQTDTGKKAHLLEDKQIPSVEVFDEVYLTFGRHLEEIHMTWAHLEKKRTRLRTDTKTIQDLKSQSVETASPFIHDAVTLPLVTASQHLLTASARTDSTRI
ncbi:hypothetical protein Tco_0648491 [Tanacetum coccineum]